MSNPFPHLSARHWMARIIGPLCLGLLTLFLTACGSTVASRIEKNPGDFARLAPQDQQLVRSGRIREGMDRMAVYLAWGRAQETYMGERQGKQMEVWQYLRTRSHYVDVAPYYPHYYDYFYAPGPILVTEDVPGKRVMFTNGIVSEWMYPRRH